MITLEARHRLLLSLTDTIYPSVSAPVIPSLLPTEILRFYQFDLLVEVARLMALGHRRILVVLPTGGGKTRMAAAMIQSASSQDLASHFVVHRKELIEQTSETFAENGIDHSFIATKMNYDPDMATTLAGVQTLVRRLADIFPPNLAVIDEAHHATAASWDAVISNYMDSDTFIVGLTATPQRLDGKGLDNHFDAMVVGPSVAELIEWGFLSPFEYYAPGIPDLTGIRTTAGDFNRKDIASLMNEPKLVGDIVDHYQRLAAGQRGIIFAASRDHSKAIIRQCLDRGIRAAHVDGDTKDRSDIVEAFRGGEYDLMSNVDLFGEGFDVPDIVYCGMGRPTDSLSMFRQQAGRAFRMFEGKTTAIIADHAGNAFRHGLPDDDIEWSLAGRVKGNRSGAGPVDDGFSIRQCKRCFRVVRSNVKICPGCETEFPVQVREVKTEAGQLSKLERAEIKEAAKVARVAENKACMSKEDFRRLAVKRGYKNPGGWAKLQMRMKNGEFFR